MTTKKVEQIDEGSENLSEVQDDGDMERNSGINSEGDQEQGNEDEPSEGSESEIDDGNENDRLEDDNSESDDAASEPGDASAASSGNASEDEGEVSQDEHEAVGAVKLPEGVELNTEDEEVSEDDSQSDASVDEENDQGDIESASSSSPAEEWEDASAGEVEVEGTVRNTCYFCKMSEEEDPSEDFEEYLACRICGNNAHQQCAREDDFLHDGEDIKAWQCPDCASLQRASIATDEAKERRLSAASQVPRDLLPAPRAGVKPGAHSIFNELIIDQDPLDGSRPLRKRKASSEAIETSSAASSKRHRTRKDSTSSSEAPASGSLSAKNQKTRRSLVNGIVRPNSGDEERELEVSPAKSHRPRRQKSESTKVRIMEKVGKRKLLLAFKVDFSRLKKSRLLKKHSRKLAIPQPHSRISHLPSTQYASPFYSLQSSELDESKNKPYGGILTETQADTSKTFPALEDRAKFDEARRRYEEEWKIKTAALEAESEVKNRTSTKISGPPSKIKCINFGGHEIDTWYAAPYPEEYSRNRVLFICEFCLKYMPSDYVAWRHKLKCPAKHPPGDEIYRDVSISVFEVDGRKNPVYCQNLCLLAKLFLGSKTLYYDVEPFLFYIMTEYDEFGYHFVGYFSKEKRPSSMNNVSCILTLPIHQRKGYGNLLIDFSYLLTRVEQKTGSPEKPLSDMGLVSYRNYWRLILARTLLEQRDPISIARISDLTGMTADDIIAGLEALRALVRDPITKSYALRIDRTFLKDTIQSWEAKKYVTLHEHALIWTPYIMGRNNLASYDRGAPISTVAPRDDEDESSGPTVQAEEIVQATFQQAAGPNEELPVQLALHDTLEEAAMVLTNSGSSVSLQTGSTPIEYKPGTKETGLSEVNGTQRTNADVQHNVNEVANAAASSQTVPPMRYEIYPPIPGTSIRRKYYRAGLKKTISSPLGLAVRRGRPPKHSTASAQQARTKDTITNGNSVNGTLSTGALTPTGRRTRSKATEDQTSASEALGLGPAGSEAEMSQKLTAKEDMEAPVVAESKHGPRGTASEANQAAFSLNQDSSMSYGEDQTDTQVVGSSEVNGVRNKRDETMVDL